MFDPIKIERQQNFKPTRRYMRDGYLLEFKNYWILSLNDRFIMDDSEKDFIEICRNLDLVPFDIKSDTIGEDSIFQNEACENVSSWRAAFPDNQDIIMEELEAYNMLDKSFSVYESVNNL